MSVPFRFLVVDDEPPVLRALERILRYCFDVPIDTVSTAEQARELLTQHRYAVVISDFHMPSEDGVTLARHIAREHPHARTILLSAHFEALYAGRASMSEGVFELVPKPWQTQHLLGVIRAAWRNSGAGPKPPPCTPQGRASCAPETDTAGSADEDSQH